MSISATIYIIRGRKEGSLTVELEGSVSHCGSYSPHERGERADLVDYIAYNENGHEVDGVILTKDELIEADYALAAAV